VGRRLHSKILAPRHIKVQSGGLSSFTVNAMVLLLLLFGRITLQTGQRASTEFLTTGDIVGHRDASPTVATPPLLKKYFLTFDRTGSLNILYERPQKLVVENQLLKKFQIVNI